MLVDVCQDAGFIIRILVKIVKYAHIIVPILLILLISFDLMKVVAGSADEKAKKEAGSKALKRVIYAVLIFFIPTIINIIFKSIEGVSSDGGNATNSTSTSWTSCWIQEYNK